MTPREITSSLPPPISNLLQSHPGQTLAGGWLRDTLAGFPTRDFDIYGPASTCPVKGRKGVVRGSNFDAQIGGLDIDWINTDKVGGDVTSSFDFRCCQVALWWSGSDWIMYYPGITAKDIGLKRLIFTPNPNLPSWHRINKLINRGWHCSEDTLANWLKMRLSGFEGEIYPEEIVEVLQDHRPTITTMGIEVSAFDPATHMCGARQEYVEALTNPIPNVVTYQSVNQYYDAQFTESIGGTFSIQNSYRSQVSPSPLDISF